MPKEEALRVRVPAAMREAIIALANQRLTSESEIAREAILEYLAKRGISAEQLRQGQIHPTPPSPERQTKYYPAPAAANITLNDDQTSTTTQAQANFAAAAQRVKKLHKAKRPPKPSPGPKP